MITKTTPYKLLIAFTFCQQKYNYESFRPKQLPVSYNINVSLLSNPYSFSISRIKTFNQLFELYTATRTFFTEKHWAFTARLLMKLVERSQIQSGRMRNKESFKIEQDKDKWRQLMQDLLKVETKYLTQDQLLDYLHLVSRSMQFRINYKYLSPTLNQLYQPFRDNLIISITEATNLTHYSIPQLVTLLHNLITLRQKSQPITNIIWELYLKLSSTPFCTSFHIILLSNHLKFLSKVKTIKDNQLLNKITRVMKKVLNDQIPVVIDYIDIFTIIQIYNIVSKDEPDCQLRHLLLTKAVNISSQINQSQSKSSFIPAEMADFVTSISHINDPQIKTTELTNTLNQYLTRLKHRKPSIK